MHKTVVRALASILLTLPALVVLAADLNGVAGLIEAGSYQQALRLLEGVPQDRAARLLRASALAGLQRSAEAESLYRALIKEAPQDPAPYNNLAALYAAQGRLQEAGDLLNQALQADERYATIHRNLSKVYVEMSRNSYAKALRMSGQGDGLQLSRLDHRGTQPQPPLTVAALAPAEGAKETQVRPPAEPVMVAPPPPVQAPATRQGVEVMAIAPKPKPEPVAQAEEFDGGGAIAALKQWATAWSSQDIEGYLDAYDREFLPPNGLSLGQWQASRRARLLKPGRIDVSLSEFEVIAGGGGTVTVKVIQRYRSDTYQDATRKGFLMMQRNGAWKIGDEYTIEVIN